MVTVNDELKRMGKEAAMACCKVVLAFIYRVEKNQAKCMFAGMGVGRGCQTTCLPLLEF
jgi:hypothetical protein